MKNECLGLINSKIKSTPRQHQQTYIVVEEIDGRVVETRLPKEKAQRLYRKIRAAGGNANLFNEMQNQAEETDWKKMPYITGFEPEA